ncbi:MAG TPA: hypothetical protein VMH83_14140 [Candidatus Acidoferrum sp.]|nr:hypothetical protein [Candidatus Acidoferrum sp.]
MDKSINLIGVFLWSTSLSAATVQVPSGVAALVAPVLKAHAAVAKHDTFATEDVEEKAMEPLFAHRTPQTDEAIAVLLGFYLGEGPGEVLTCEAIARGKVMLPFIEKYERVEIVVPGVNHAKTRPSKTLYSRVRPSIEAGEDCKWDTED